jgi:hypothetical protein
MLTIIPLIIYLEDIILVALTNSFRPKSDRGTSPSNGVKEGPNQQMRYFDARIIENRALGNGYFVLEWEDVTRSPKAGPVSS